jgi:hypothetical protein
MFHLLTQRYPATDHDLGNSIGGRSKARFLRAWYENPESSWSRSLRPFAAEACRHGGAQSFFGAIFGSMKGPASG